MSDCKKTILEMPKAMRQALAAGERSDTFDTCMRLQGKVFRDVKGRKTQQVEIAKKSYFIKQHFGVGWGEIFKNLIIFKLPILGALTEVAAIQKLAEIGINTTPLVAYGRRGCNPATQQSFVMTEDLGEIVTAEELSADWQNKPAEFKQNLIVALAETAKKLHAAGLCHRDFYLCHFVFKQADLACNQLNVYLIDLHRMLQNQPINGDAVMKDIAGFYFSALQAGWSEDDLALFKQHYLPQLPGFWGQVSARSQGLLNKFNSKKFQARLTADREKLS